MVSGFGEIIERAHKLVFMIIGISVLINGISVPLAIWKVIDIVRWLGSHV